MKNKRVWKKCHCGFSFYMWEKHGKYVYFKFLSFFPHLSFLHFLGGGMYFLVIWTNNDLVGVRVFWNSEGDGTLRRYTWKKFVKSWPCFCSYFSHLFSSPYRTSSSSQRNYARFYFWVSALVRKNSGLLSIHVWCGPSSDGHHQFTDWNDWSLWVRVNDWVTVCCLHSDFSLST